MHTYDIYNNEGYPGCSFLKDTAIKYLSSLLWDKNLTISVHKKRLYNPSHVTGLRNEKKKKKSNNKLEKSHYLKLPWEY